MVQGDPAPILFFKFGAWTISEIPLSDIALATADVLCLPSVARRAKDGFRISSLARAVSLTLIALFCFWQGGIYTNIFLSAAKAIC